MGTLPGFVFAGFIIILSALLVLRFISEERERRRQEGMRRAESNRARHRVAWRPHSRRAPNLTPQMELERELLRRRLWASGGAKKDSGPDIGQPAEVAPDGVPSFAESAGLQPVLLPATHLRVEAGLQPVHATLLLPLSAGPQVIGPSQPGLLPGAHPQAGVVPRPGGELLGGPQLPPITLPQVSAAPRPELPPGVLLVVGAGPRGAGLHEPRNVTGPRVIGLRGPRPLQGLQLAELSRPRLVPETITRHRRERPYGPQPLPNTLLHAQAGLRVIELSEPGILTGTLLQVRPAPQLEPVSGTPLQAAAGPQLEPVTLRLTVAAGLGVILPGEPRLLSGEHLRSDAGLQLVPGTLPRADEGLRPIALIQIGAGLQLIRPNEQQPVSGEAGVGGDHLIFEALLQVDAGLQVVEVDEREPLPGTVPPPVSEPLWVGPAASWYAKDVAEPSETVVVSRNLTRAKVEARPDLSTNMPQPVPIAPFRVDGSGAWGDQLLPGKLLHSTATLRLIEPHETELVPRTLLQIGARLQPERLPEIHLPGGVSLQPVTGTLLQQVSAAPQAIGLGQSELLLPRAHLRPAAEPRLDGEPLGGPQPPPATLLQINFAPPPESLPGTLLQVDAGPQGINSYEPGPVLVQRGIELHEPPTLPGTLLRVEAGIRPELVSGNLLQSDVEAPPGREFLNWREHVPGPQIIDTYGPVLSQVRQVIERYEPELAIGTLLQIDYSSLGGGQPAAVTAGDVMAAFEKFVAAGKRRPEVTADDVKAAFEKFVGARSA